MRKEPPFSVSARFLAFVAMVLTLLLSYNSAALGQTTDEYFTMDGKSIDLADHYLTSGQPEKAISLYQTVLRHFPGVPFIHMELAKAYKTIEKWKKALKHTRIAHKLAPLDNRIASDYAELCIITGDPKDAVPVLQKLLERVPDYPKAKERLIKASMKSKKWKVAIPFLQEKINAAPSDIEAKRMLARCYRGAKMWENAIEEYNAVLEEKPDSGEALWGVADSYRATHKPKLARAALEKRIEKDPEDKKAQKAVRNFNTWMSSGTTKSQPSTFISTSNPSIMRQRGLITMFTPESANEQITYDFYYQRQRNKKTSETSTSIFHDAEFNTVLNDKLQANLDFSTRQDDNNKGVTPIMGYQIQYNWSEALDYQFTAGFEPHRGGNRQFSIESEVDWWAIDDMELKFTDTQTRYWDSNYSNSASFQGTYHAHRFVRGLRFRWGGYNDMINRPSPYFTSIDGHAKPLMLWTAQFDVEKDFQLPLGVLLTGGYSFAYNSNNTKTHTGYGGVQRHIGEHVFIFGSFSGGVDSDEMEYLGAGAYIGINFKF